MALRSAKSKLGKGKFHNKEMQLQYDKTPNSFTFHDVDLLDSEENKEINGIGKLFEVVKGEWLDDGYLAYNDITIVEVKKKVEVDPYGINDLSSYESDLIKLILKNIERIDIDALTTIIERGLENN